MKRSTRLLSLLLAALMLLTALPAVSAADDPDIENTPIETVIVTFIPPEPGIDSATSGPAFAVDSNLYTIEAVWDDSVQGTFENGQSYSFSATVTPAAGYCFNKNTELDITGVDSTNWSFHTDDGLSWISFTSSFTVRSSEPETTYPTIETASVTLTAPAAGSSSTAAPVVSVPEGCNYEVEISCWYHEDGTYADVGEVEQFTFAAGTTYKMWVSIKATNNYVFDSSTQVEVIGGTKIGTEVSPASFYPYSSIHIDASVKIAEPETETCTITFDANGGEGKMDPVTVEKGAEYTLPKCTFTPPYSSTFSGWDLGKAGEKITVTADTVIKAQWKIVKTAPKLTVKNASFKASVKTKKYTVTLKDKNGKAISGVKLTLKVNKKTFTAKTNSKGQATFKITKLTKKGSYKATVSFAGNQYFKKVSKTSKITVK